MRPPDTASAKGLRQYLDDDEQRAWLEGASLADGERPRSDDLEQRFKYAGRLEKLLRLPQAADVIAILRAYAATCLPIPRTTERFYWSVSCLPGSPDKPLARISASFMELFALHADPAPRGPGLRARFILHLSDFTHDGSIEADRLDRALIDRCAGSPTDHFFWKADTFGVKVRSADAIRAFVAHSHARRAIRRFNLIHMNRGRNAYQASHCYSLADRMIGE
jgi:hypothetical protein